MLLIRKYKTISIVIAVMLILVSAISSGCSAKEEAPPTRGDAPAGFKEYSKSIDVEFTKAVASHISEFGDDPATGNRTAGSPAEKETAEFIEQTMKDIGLQNVTADEVPVDGWTFNGAQIDFKATNGEHSVATLGGYQTQIIATGESIPIICLGRGTAADYEGIDVSGKLVLIEINPEEWWINYPALQAKLKGAKAIIAVSIMDEEIPDRLVSQDICGAADAPALSISRNDYNILKTAIELNGYESGGAKQLYVSFTADSEVTKDTVTSNVWGEIPGETDEVIYFIGHYDGYYHSFYDNASGIGAALGMAKAFIDSGYKPNKTLRFLFHGAEEWGKTDSEADWATGAYQQIVKTHPEWSERAFALFNVDSGYPLSNMESFDVSAPYEFQQFIHDTIVSFGDRSSIAIASKGQLPSPYREDFIYNAVGIPTVAIVSGEGEERYFSSFYHSNRDLLSNGGFNEDGLIAINSFLGYSAMRLDQMLVMPLNMAARFEALMESYTDFNTRGYFRDAHLLANIDRAIEAAQIFDQRIADINKEYAQAITETDQPKIDAMNALAADMNGKVHAAYRNIQDQLLRLSWNLEYEFGNQGIMYNIKALDGAVAALREEDAETAVYDYLSAIDFVYMSTVFDKQTCDYFTGRMYSSIEGTWAEGRLVSNACYADTVVRSLLEKLKLASADVPEAEDEEAAKETAKAAENADEDVYVPDFGPDIEQIEKSLKQEQLEQLAAVMQQQSESLPGIIDRMNRFIDANYEYDASAETQK